MGDCENGTNAEEEEEEPGEGTPNGDVLRARVPTPLPRPSTDDVPELEELLEPILRGGRFGRLRLGAHWLSPCETIPPTSVALPFG